MSYNYWELTDKLKDLYSKIFVMNNAIVELYETRQEEEERQTEAYKKLLSDQAVAFDKKYSEAKERIYAQERAWLEHVKAVADLERMLGRYVPRSNILFPFVKDDGLPFDLNEGYEILNKISSRGIGSTLKKLAREDGWNTNTQMAGQLYIKLDREKKRIDEINKDTDRLTRELEKAEKAIEAEMRETLEKNENDIKRQIEAGRRALADQVASTKASASKGIRQDEYDDINEYYASSAELIGDKEGWQHYTPVVPEITEDNGCGFNKRYLIGRHLEYVAEVAYNDQPLFNWDSAAGRHDAIEFAGGFLGNLLCFRKKPFSYVLPLTHSLWSMVKIYAECEGQTLSTSDVFRDIVLRHLRFMPKNTIKVYYADPVHQGASLGSLIRLTKESKGCGVVEYRTKTSEIGDMIAGIASHVADTMHKLTASGCEDIYDYNKEHQNEQINYTMLVLCDFPHGYTAQIIHDLEVIIHNADRCGIGVLISRNTADKLEGYSGALVNDAIGDGIVSGFCFMKNNDDKLSRSNELTFSLVKTTREDGTYPPFKRIEVSPSPEFFDELNKAYSEKVVIETGYDRYYPAGYLPEIRSAEKNLRFPIMVDEKGEIVEFVMDHDLKGYGLITGNVGSGKTSLLNTIIMGGAMHYHPDELEMWLVDYKTNQFDAYEINRLPHVRHIVADPSETISYSIIDTILQEKERRARLFQKAKEETGKTINDYGKYRKAGYMLPRLLVIVDEFHNMSRAVSAESEYRQKLEKILYEARSHGINILFCTQLVSNLKGLSDDVMGLIPIRIAMRNAASEVKTNLSMPTSPDEKLSGNIVSLSSALQGTMIYKHEEGSADDEFSRKIYYEYGRSLFATNEQVEAKLIEIRERIGGYDRPLEVYSGQKRHKYSPEDIADYEDRVPITPHEGERVYIGSNQGLGRCFHMNIMRPKNGENILMVGDNGEMRRSMMRRIIRNARSRGREVVILVGKGSLFYANNKSFLNDCRRQGCRIYSTAAEVCRYIGLKAEKLEAMASGFDSETSVARQWSTLVIMPDADSTYKYLGSLSLNRKQAWDTMTSEPAPTLEPASVPAPASVPNSGGAHVADDEIARREKEIKEAEEEYMRLMAIIGGGAAAPAAEPKPEPKSGRFDKDLEWLNKLLGEDSEGGEGDSFDGNLVCDSMGLPEGAQAYNACADMLTMINEGFKLGIMTFITTDTSSGFYTDMRAIRDKGSFNHRIVMRMSGENAGDILAKAQAMNIINAQNNNISAVYEYMKGTARTFNPYLDGE
ncbi:MAG: hypothetical protein IJF53_03050 [Clostridia bacterium]|nr:hypothetical protein [Clostridia bacterium]